MARQLFKIDGLSDLDAALSELPKATSRAILVRTLMKEGQVVADAEKALAPRRTGKLALSPTVSQTLTRRQKSLNVKESDVEVYIGPTSHPKSIQTEFGNSHQAPQPHLRPAWDANAEKVLNGIANTLADEIEKTRARIAKKAEREASKMKA